MVTEFGHLVGSRIEKAFVLGVGSWIRIDFTRPGGPSDAVGESSPWSLWVTLASWRVDGATRVLGACEDAHDVMSRALGSLVGEELTDVSVGFPGLEAAFSFGEIDLLLFPVHSLTGSGRNPEDGVNGRHWVVSSLSESSLSEGSFAAGPGSTWSVGERADAWVESVKKYLTLVPRDAAAP
jgi:hypothetical protein